MVANLKNNDLFKVTDIIIYLSKYQNFAIINLSKWIFIPLPTYSLKINSYVIN